MNIPIPIPPITIKGIPNIGNTCFLNTCLQILLQTPEFDINDSEVRDKNIPEQSIWIEWKRWKEAQENPTIRFVSPGPLFHAIQSLANQKGISLFTGYVQNDLSEFLLFFIDAMHDYFKRPINTKIQGNIENETDKMAIECYKMLQETYHHSYSDILDIFYGISVSNVYSMNPNTKPLSSKPESFFILDLPIPTSISGNKMNIYSCLDHYVSPEFMENGWIHETTKQTQSVYKNTVFWNFPKILVISFQRFHTKYIPNHPNAIQISKNTDFVDFPLEELDLSKYVVGYKASTFRYDLYGIVNHIGDVNGGHYTAFVKQDLRQWYHCNDEVIQIVPKEVLSTMITPMAYMLFYRRITV
jgi:ubiquitin C-terminal hydrolase